MDYPKIAAQFVYDWMLDPRYVKDGERVIASDRSIFTDALARTMEEAFELPKVEGLPTKAGLYWARSTSLDDLSVMKFNPVAFVPAGLLEPHAVALLFGGDDRRPASEFIDWRGPIQEPT